MGTMSVLGRLQDQDYYLQHMKDTMDWIERKMREAEEEAAKAPTLRKRGYDVGIYVEARWLKQLLAEAVAKHQMLLSMQREIFDRAVAGMSLMPQSVVFPNEKESKR
jgi:hypothetical protein